MTISLRHCVREAQHGNHEAVLFLLHEFEPLIRKYVKNIICIMNRLKKLSQQLTMLSSIVFSLLT